MTEFNWEIGTVPSGWKPEYGVQLRNGDFARGQWASITPGLIPPGEPVDFDTLVYVRFHYDQRVKVKAWLNWFTNEQDAQSKEPK
jgi:hypothetical protein